MTYESARRAVKALADRTSDGFKEAVASSLGLAIQDNAVVTTGHCSCSVEADWGATSACDMTSDERECAIMFAKEYLEDLIEAYDIARQYDWKYDSSARLLDRVEYSVRSLVGFFQEVAVCVLVAEATRREAFDGFLSELIPLDEVPSRFEKLFE